MEGSWIAGTDKPRQCYPDRRWIAGDCRMNNLAIDLMEMQTGEEEKKKRIIG